MTLLTKQGGIYVITNTVNGKCYVGSARIFSNRWSCHRVALRNGTHRSGHLQASWAKHGESSFRFEVIEVVDVSTEGGKDRLIAREQYWIDQKRAFLDGYNLAPRAWSNLGIKHTAETRAKASARQMGKKRTPEMHAKIIAAQTGLKRSPETCARIAAALTGKQHTEETKEKLRAVRAGRKMGACPPERREKIRQALLGKAHSSDRVEKNRRSHLGKRRGPMPEERKLRIAESNRRSWVERRAKAESP